MRDDKATESIITPFLFSICTSKVWHIYVSSLKVCLFTHLGLDILVQFCMRGKGLLAKLHTNRNKPLLFMHTVQCRCKIAKKIYGPQENCSLVLSFVVWPTQKMAFFAFTPPLLVHFMPPSPPACFVHYTRRIEGVSTTVHNTPPHIQTMNPPNNPLFILASSAKKCII